MELTTLKKKKKTFFLKKIRNFLTQKVLAFKGRKHLFFFCYYTLRTLGITCKDNGTSTYSMAWNKGTLLNLFFFPYRFNGMFSPKLLIL
jgi:hypothetical protein